MSLLSPVHRAARRVARAHLPSHNRAEPVLVGSGYALSAVTFHSVVGTVVVAVAYGSVATLAWLDARRQDGDQPVRPALEVKLDELAQLLGERVDECHGRHAACQNEAR